MLKYVLLLINLIRAIVRDREALVAENLVVRHQLAVLTRPTRRRPRLRARDKLFWVVVRALRRDWRRHLVLVRPESVIRWHRQAWRLFWRWRSRGPTGRPRTSAELRELIITMARDNPRWGSQRIRGELLKLGLVVSKRSIQALPTARAGAPVEPDLAHVPDQPRPSLEALESLEAGQAPNLPHEVDARWRLVEMAWELNLPSHLLTVAYDGLTERLVTNDRHRRKAITGVRSALNGYQGGRCFYCYRDLAIDGQLGSFANLVKAFR